MDVYSLRDIVKEYDGSVLTEDVKATEDEISKELTVIKRLHESHKPVEPVKVVQMPAIY